MFLGRIAYSICPSPSPRFARTAPGVLFPRSFIVEIQVVQGLRRGLGFGRVFVCCERSLFPLRFWKALRRQLPVLQRALKLQWRFRWVDVRKLHIVIQAY